jgi:hypothetical protein
MGIHAMNQPGKVSSIPRPLSFHLGACNMYLYIRELLKRDGSNDHEALRILNSHLTMVANLRELQSI